MSANAMAARTMYSKATCALIPLDIKKTTLKYMLKLINPVKAQASIEFMGGVIIVLMAVSIAALLYSQKSLESAQAQTDFQARNLCEKAADAISSANALGNGSAATFNASNKIGDADYEIWVAPPTALIQIRYAAGTVNCRAATTAITNAEGTQPVLFKTNNDFQASNRNGWILVE